MKIEETSQEEDSIHTIHPVSVADTDSPKAKELYVEVPAGHVYIVALNPDGTEKENSGFFYPERSYRRIYGDEKKYSVKKKVR